MNNFTPTHTRISEKWLFFEMHCTAISSVRKIICDKFQLRENFDCGRETKIGSDQCPHDVATLLKEYFRDLPDPLLCRELYQAFVHTQSKRKKKVLIRECEQTAIVTNVAIHF